MNPNDPRHYYRIVSATGRVPPLALRAFLEAAPRRYREHFSPDCCINGTRVAIDTLSKLGLTAKPAAARLDAWNAAARAFHQEHPTVPPAGSPERAAYEAAWHARGCWIVGVDTKTKDDPAGWPGHLIALVKGGWLLDVSLGQLARPQRAIELPQMIAIDVAGDFLEGTGATAHYVDMGGPPESGAALVYRLQPERKDFLTMPGWKRHAGNAQVTTTVHWAARDALYRLRREGH